MNKIGRLFLILTLCAAPAFAETTLYENNFEKAALDQAPDDFLVLDGDFAVKQSDGNKFLELPGAPLDTFGILFGPTTNAGVRVSARIYATGKGQMCIRDSHEWASGCFCLACAPAPDRKPR